MGKITPHLWYDTQAGEAAELYTSTFPGSKITDVTTLHDTPSGDSDLVSFEIFDESFMAISAGPFFTFNPSVSFMVVCADGDEIDGFWQSLSQGGTPYMPLGEYPFSKRYGWLQDRYGLSWQLMLTDAPLGRRVIPTLMFVGDVCGKTEEAVAFYTSVFPNSNVDHLFRYGSGEDPNQAGTIKHAGFELDGMQFAAMDSARDHGFAFNEAISFLVRCDTQEEIDRYWSSLSAVPEAEQCGWLKDKYGLSWQVAPSAMDVMMRTGTEEQIARVTQAFLKMKKFDLAELEKAFSGS